jgi:hypothetical protein
MLHFVTEGPGSQEIYESISLDIISLGFSDFNGTETVLPGIKLLLCNTRT